MKTIYTMAAAAGAASLLLTACEPRDQFTADGIEYTKRRDSVFVFVQETPLTRGSVQESLKKELVVSFNKGIGDPKTCMSLTYSIEPTKEKNGTGFDKSSPLAREYVSSIDPGLREDVEIQYDMIANAEISNQQSAFNSCVGFGDDELATRYAAELKRAAEFRSKVLKIN